jgi:hypothetical protein
MLGGLTVGSIRVYARELCEFTNQDITFVTTMANLASVALSSSLQHQGNKKAELGRTAFPAEYFLHNLPLKFRAETPLVPHGKILSIPHYRIF